MTGCGGDVTVYGADRVPIAFSAFPGMRAPQFGPNGQIVALDGDGSVLFLRPSG